MANISGTRTTQVTANPRIDLSTMLATLVDPIDTAIFSWIKHTPQVVRTRKHEWMERNALSNSSTLSAAIVDAGATTVFNVADGTAFKAGAVIQVDSEQMRVTSVAGNALTVTRAYAGSTGATHLINATVDLVSYAVAEDGDPAAASSTNPTRLFNLIQIGQEAVTASDFELGTESYGDPSKLARLIGDATTRLAITYNKALARGLRFQDDPNKTATMGGLKSFLTTNYDGAVGAFTEAALVNKLGICFGKGGRPDTLFTDASIAQKIDAFVTAGAGTNVKRETPLDGAGQGAGGFVTQYTSRFGVLNIVVDRWLPAGTVILAESKGLSFVTYSPFTYEPLAKTGMATKGQVVGAGTLEVVGEKHMAYLEGAS